MMGKDSPSPYRFVIEAILFLTYALFGATWASCGSLLKEMMGDLHLDLGQAGFLSTAVSFAKIFGPALAGALAARLGLRWAIALASGLICLGVVAPFSPDFTTLLLARFAMGLGGAMVVVYFTPMVIAWFPQKERAAVNGVNFVAINVGMGLALTLTPSLTRWTGSWKGTLLAYSLLNIALLVAWLAFGRSSGEAVSPATAGARKGYYGEAMRDGNLWKLVFAYSGVLSFYLVLFTYFPTYYREAFTGAGAALAQKAPAVAMWAGIPAALLGIALTKRSGLRVPFVRLSGALLVCAVPVLYLAAHPLAVTAAAVLTGIALFLWASPFFTIPTELPGMTAEKSSSFMGIFWAACYMVATLLVWLTGKMAISFGFVSAFAMITVASGTLLVGSFLIPETGPGAAGATKLSPRSTSPLQVAPGR